MLNLSDYWVVRPDVGARQEMLGGEMPPPAACSKKRRWARLSEEDVAEKIKGVVARLEAEHVQLKMDGVRNIWLVKPGIDTYIHVYIYPYIHLYIYTYIHVSIYIYTCLHVCTCDYICLHVNTCVYTCIHV